MERNFLAKAALVQIPNAKPDAKQIVGLVKESGRVTGYKLSDQRFVSKSEAVQMAKQGDISGVGIAHRKGNEYLKAIPNSKENTIRANI